LLKLQSWSDIRFKSALFILRVFKLRTVTVVLVVVAAAVAVTKHEQADVNLLDFEEQAEAHVGCGADAVAQKVLAAAWLLTKAAAQASVSGLSQARTRAGDSPAAAAKKRKRMIQGEETKIVRIQEKRTKQELRRSLAMRL
jgi:Mn2+/Fe2+ NRAMP family transporter